MELDDRAKIETFLQSHESELDLPPVQEGETIFEYVVDSNGKLKFFFDEKCIIKYPHFHLFTRKLLSPWK